MTQPTLRHESPYVPLTREQFRSRFLARLRNGAYRAPDAGLRNPRQK